MGACRNSLGVVLNEDFQRIKRLPPYVFNIVNELKAQARARGEDIVDFGMGNPDLPTPKHIVDKLTEASQRPDTHRTPCRAVFQGCGVPLPVGITVATTWPSTPRVRPL